MTVYLVGAGPGDPGLITVRGAQLLSGAQAVVHDRLVHHNLLDMVPSTAEVHDVGKRPGSRHDQSGINGLLVALGSRLSTVVRLKGGDPLVFGRGGEEVLALQLAGIDFEIVPGVSSLNGVAAYAGIPLTHRAVSTGFTVVTGHGADPASTDHAAVDWEALARLGGTIVILMGVEHRAEIAGRLMGGGLVGETPVGVIEEGTLPSQRVNRTTLGGLGAIAVSNPATIIVGDVAALDLSWFVASSGPTPWPSASSPLSQPRPQVTASSRAPEAAGTGLAGWHVVVTRAGHQSRDIVAKIQAAGAKVMAVPMISVDPPADGGFALRRAARGLHEYDWVVLTSVNAVDRLFAEIAVSPRAPAALISTKFACIGAATATAVYSHGAEPALVPPEASSEALAAALGSAMPEASPSSPGLSRILLPRAATTRDVLAGLLRQTGYEVDEVEAYCLSRPPISTEQLGWVRGADAVVFASGSAVAAWAGVIGAGQGLVAVCIGPVTAEAARTAGFENVLEAGERSVDGLVRTLSEYAQSHSR